MSASWREVRHLIRKQVLFLWERLPAAMSSWLEATPQEESPTCLKGALRKEVVVKNDRDTGRVEVSA
jgi:hypothetical protein